MVRTIYTEKFEKDVKKVDSFIKQKLIKQVKKIIDNSEIGKPLKYDLKGERTIYVKHYRIIYTFREGVLIFLRFEHRKNVYE